MQQDLNRSSIASATPRLPQTTPTTAPRPPADAVPPEDESDDPNVPVPVNATCKRRGCDATFTGGSRDDESCVHHPGQALFHEGSKGWTCCKRRVLDFDDFLKIEGCKTKTRHLFVGRKKNNDKEEVLQSVRCD